MNPFARHPRSVPALLLAILTAGACLAWWTLLRTDREMRAALLQQTRMVAQALNGDCAQSLVGSAADLENPGYLRLKEQLAAIRSVIPQCRFLYLMGRRADGRLFFFVDSEPVASKDYSPPGQLYEEAPAEYSRVFSSRSEAVEGPKTDRWGTWITALVPLHDPLEQRAGTGLEATTEGAERGASAGLRQDAGTIRAVLGMDTDAHDWNRQLVRAALPPALLTLALAALLLVGAALLARRARPGGPPPRWLRHLEAALAIAGGAVLTAFAAYLTHQRETSNRTLDFENHASSHTEAITDTLHLLLRTELESLARFYETTEAVTPGEFQHFTAYLANNPAIQAWEWIPAVPAADKARFEARIGIAGVPGFAIWQKDAQGQREPATGREIFYPISQVVPMPGNEAVMGFDIGSDPLRRKGLEAAARSGLVTGTDPVTLLQETGKQKGLLIYRPVFDHAQPPRLHGFVSAALCMGTLLRNVAPDNPALLELALLHPHAPPETLATDWDGTNAPPPTIAVTRPILAFGKAFAVTAHANPEFMLRHPANAAWLTTLTGLVLSTSLAVVLSGLYRRREKLECLVAERSHELLENEALQRVLLANLPVGVVIVDPLTRIIERVNEHASVLFGAPVDHLLGQRCHALLCPADEGACPVCDLGKAVDNSEREMLRADGSRLPILKTVKRIQLKGQEKLLECFVDLSARKQAEDVLRLKTALLEAQANATLDGLLVVDDQGKRILKNQRIDEMFDVPAPILADEDDSALLAHVVGLTKEPEPYLAKVRYLYEHRDETSHDEIEFKNGMVIDRYSAPVLDKEGKNHGRIWTFRDITARKQAELALRESAFRLRAITDSAYDAIVMMDANGNITYWNPAAERILGYPGAEALGQCLHTLIVPPRYREAHTAAFPWFQQTGQGQVVGKTLDLEALRKDGQEISVQLALSAIRLNDAWHAVGILRDITQRKQAELALAQATDRLTLAARAGGVGIWDFDVFNNQLLWDKQMYHLHGITPDQFGGAYEAWQAGLHPDDRARGDAEIQAALRGEKEFDTEFRVIWPDGSLHNIRALALVQRDSSGQALRMIGTNWDITALKQAEVALLKTKQLAEHANEAKTQFLANMSHEIRTPMNGVIGMTDLLLGTQLSDEQRHYTEALRASGEALLSLINDILDFSKIEAGKLDLEMLDFDLVTLLDNFAALLAPQAHKRGLEFSCVIAPDVPPGLSGDPGRLRQILLNLASNAIKFTPHGEVTVQVSLVSATPTASVLRFAVRDTGIGIPAHQQALLFQKFTQMDASTARHYGGTGLGLAISKQLVHLMDGEIGVSSVVGQGSEFWFTACFAACLQALPAAAPRSQPAPALSRPHWRGLRVLMAEDNLINQKVALGFLQKLALQVDVVASGTAAIHALTSSPYALVLMDMQMPEMDGLEATRLIRAPQSPALNPRITIIAMTANAMQGDEQICLAAGMNDYISKPLSPNSLVSILDKWLPQAPED